MSEILKPQNELQLAFLNETAAHFNLNNRSTTSNEGCSYLPKEGVSEGCAIGRKIADKKLCAELDEFGYIGSTADETSSARVFNKLPQELQDLGQDFLNVVQQLHDSEYNWTETGLSPVGVEKVETIKIKFCLV